jgi:hypothetical protein
MCLNRIFALLAPKKAALSWPIEDTHLGKPQSAQSGLSMAMSGPAQTTTAQSRLDHSQWLRYMKLVYLQPSQHPKRIALYNQIMGERWMQRKRDLMLEAREVTHAELARETGKPIYLGADHGAN